MPHGLCHLATVFGTGASLVAAGGGQLQTAEDDGGSAAVVTAHNPGDGVGIVALNADAGDARS